MGFRFRKSFKCGPFRTTISKSGVGFSAGVPGARITKKANGNTMKTISIPGTGISHVSETSKKKKNNVKSVDTDTNTNISISPPTFKSFLMSLLRIALCVIIGVLCDFGVWIVIVGGIWGIIYFIRQCIKFEVDMDKTE